MTKWFKFLRLDQPLLFAVPQFSMRLMGYWPKSDSLWFRSRALLHFGILAIGVGTELHAGFVYLQRMQITSALETLCPAGTSAVSLLKMFLLLNYRHDLAFVVARLRYLLFEDSAHISARQKDLIVRKHCLKAARINFWTLSTGFFTCTTYSLKPLILVLVLYAQQRNDEIVWRTPFNMTMPQLLLQSPWFPLTYLFTVYTGYVTIFMFGGCDGFYFEFCTHICSLFKCLQAELEAIFQPFEDRLQLNSEQCLNIEQQLVRVVGKQNAIMELTYLFRKRYAIITLAHFVSASLVIGFSIIDLMTVGGNGLGVLLYIAYSVTAMSQLLVYCYGGTLVAESSGQLATVMGMCPWQLCQPRQRRYVLLIILRSQRSVTMAVPFFSTSLVTFATILQASGSIIALAKSFQ